MFRGEKKMAPSLGQLQGILYHGTGGINCLDPTLIKAVQGVGLKLCIRYYGPYPLRAHLKMRLSQAL